MFLLANSQESGNCIALELTPELKESILFYQGLLQETEKTRGDTIYNIDIDWPLTFYRESARHLLGSYEISFSSDGIVLICAEIPDPDSSEETLRTNLTSLAISKDIITLTVYEKHAEDHEKSGVIHNDTLLKHFQA